MVFTVQYYNGSSWVTVPNALFSQIIDELNGQLELDFIIPNTSANLTFVQSNQQVQLLWGSTVIFSGLLMAYTATFTQITCTVYNNTFEVMQKRQITGAYNNVAANTVLAAICSAAGMTAGSCPTTPVSIQFNSTDCLTAVQNLAALLNQNVYNTGSTVIIGVKGNQTPTAITIDTQSSVNFDRSKTGYAGVIIRGVNPTGQVIIGTAGSTGAGNNTITLTNKAVSSVASLNALADAYLQSLAETNSGCPLEADISQTAALNSGDLVTITNGADLGLSGNYAIYRITKNLTKSTLEIVTSAGAFLALINATSSINGVVASLANASAALQTLPSGSDPNTSGMYVTLTDNYGDVASLMLGNNPLLPVPSSGFPASFLTFNSSYLTYIIPSVANQNGSAATATITPQSGSPYTAPMIGLGTYKYPFLWVDQVFCYTDFLNSLESSAITLLCPLNTGTIGSATVGSSGQVLQSQGSGAPPKWATITTTLTQMPLGTSGYFLEGQGSSAPIYAQVTFSLLGGTITTAQLGSAVTPATLSGSGAVPSGWTITYGQISNYTSMPVQFSQLTGVTTADPVFDSVNCTNTSAAIKISPSSNPSAPYLVMTGNYTISSTAYNVLNTYAYPLYITGTANPMVYINGNLTVIGTINGTISGMLPLTGGTLTGALIIMPASAGWTAEVKYGFGSTTYIVEGIANAGGYSLGYGTQGLGDWFVYGNANNAMYLGVSTSGKVATHNNTLDDSSGNMTLTGKLSFSNNASCGFGSAAYSSFSGVCAAGIWSAQSATYGGFVFLSDDWSNAPIFAWYGSRNGTRLMSLDSGGNADLTGYLQLGTGGGSSNTSGRPHIFCRTDSVAGCTIQMGASGQRLDIVDYGWTVDLLLLDQSGNLTISNQVTAPTLWVSGSWLSSSSTLYIGGASGAAVTMYMNGNVNPISDNAYGLGSGSNRWAGISCVTAYVAASVEILGTTYNNALFGNAFWGTGNGGIQWYDGAFNIMTNGNWFYFRGSWGGGAVFSISSVGAVSCGSLSCTAISIGGNIIPTAGSTYYCGSSSYPWNIVDTNYMYCNVINSLSGSGITIYGGSGTCGTSSSYWNYVYSAYFYYIHAPTGFNEELHDEFNDQINFDLIRNFKFILDEKGKKAFHPDCIKHLRGNEGFYESGKMDGWHLSVQQAMVKIFDRHDASLLNLQTEVNTLGLKTDSVQEKLDSAYVRIDELQLQVDELTRKLGGD